MILSEQDRILLNRIQQDFPLHPEPFKLLAEELGVSEQEILQRLQELECENAISRFGAVFNHHRAGASTLAAIAVPEQEIDQVADFINRFSEVNHNYQREHDYNLWFVVNATEQSGVERVLKTIEAKFGYPLLNLPMIKGYHIDLGFPL